MNAKLPKNNLLWQKKKKSRMEEIRIPEGTTPERELFRTSRTCNCGISASFAGILPEKPLKLKSSLLSILKLPKLEGNFTL
jgi:hypothetical protein